MKLKTPTLVNLSTNRDSREGSGIALLLHTALLDDSTSLSPPQIHAPDLPSKVVDSSGENTTPLSAITRTKKVQTVLVPPSHLRVSRAPLMPIAPRNTLHAATSLTPYAVMSGTKKESYLLYQQSFQRFH